MPAPIEAFSTRRGPPGAVTSPKLSPLSSNDQTWTTQSMLAVLRLTSGLRTWISLLVSGASVALSTGLTVTVVGDALSTSGIGGAEIEVQGQVGHRSLGDDPRIVGERQRDRQRPADRVAGCAVDEVGGRHRDSVVGGAEHDIGLAVLERLLRGAVAALWHLIGGEDLREDHQLRDVDLGDRRDPLDDGAVRASEAEGVDLDDVADDIPRRIRQRCHRGAAAVSGTLLARGRGAREHTRAGAGSAARQRQQRRHGKCIPQNADSTPHPVGQLTCLVHG